MGAQVVAGMRALLVLSWYMVTLSFLHPAGRCRSYTYPRLADILELPAADILFIADPKTVTGRSYTLSLEEMDKADSIPL